MKTDWIEHIVEGKNKRRSNQEQENQALLQKRQQFETHATHLWKKLHPRLLQAIGRYNSLVAEEDKVLVENSQEPSNNWSMNLRKQGPRRASMFICLSKETEQIICGRERFKVKMSDTGAQIWNHRLIPENEWEQCLLRKFLET
jgi:hypothetical protein